MIVCISFYFFLVHDGTGLMNCLLDPNLLKTIQIPRIDDIPEVKDPVTDAARVLLSSLRHLHCKFPKEEDLVPGTTVCYYFNFTRCVFKFKKIVFCDFTFLGDNTG